MDSVAVVVIAVLGAVFVLAFRAATQSASAPPAPRLSPEFATAVLLRAGFPATAHNVFALRERLGVEFLAQARDEIRSATPELWDRVVDRCDGARADTARWPQLVLDEIAGAHRSAAASAAQRGPEMLLATVGTGRGFFGGSVYVPLPVAAGPVTAGPVAAPVVPAPAAPVVPAPAVPTAAPAGVTSAGVTSAGVTSAGVTPAAVHPVSDVRGAGLPGGAVPAPATPVDASRPTVAA